MSAVGANFLILSLTFCIAASSIAPNPALVLAVAASKPSCPATFPAASTSSSVNSALPDSNASLTSFKNIFLSFAVPLLNTVRIAGNILSMSISKSLDKFLATLASAALKPIDSLSILNCSAVLPLLALKLAMVLSIHLSNFELATSKFLFLLVILPISLPVPPRIPVNNAPSVPNLILFNISLEASGLVSLLSILVGPPIRSPNVPAWSTSPMNTPSAIPPPNAPAINALPLPFAVSSKALSAALTIAGSATLNNVLFLPASIEVFAMLLALLNATPPGTPMFTNSFVIFPAAVASAFSSNSVRLSNHASTCAALPLSTPRSIMLAPREKKPLGIPIRPDATPDSIDSIVPTLLLFSTLFKAVK